ncbi:MAG: helix-turn-helix domain-containing protein [Alphaproteobacteria bacterium]|nr:helix-turn-helix domain-containing protein [Alphaproteobacteria bacterium]
MVLLITPSKAQAKLAENVRLRRLDMGLTQAGLAERSGVALPTLRKFEQQGAISLESLFKILMVVGGLEEVVKVTEPTPAAFASIDDVLKADNRITRKRGRRK